MRYRPVYQKYSGPEMYVERIGWGERFIKPTGSTGSALVEIHLTDLKATEFTLYSFSAWISVLERKWNPK